MLKYLFLEFQANILQTKKAICNTMKATCFISPEILTVWTLLPDVQTYYARS